MKSNTYGTKPFITQPFVVSFPALFEKRSFQDQKPKYSLDAIFDRNTDFSKFISAIKEVGIERFGDNIPSRFSNDNGKFKDTFFNFVLKNGDEKINIDGVAYEGYPGKVYMKFSSINPVGIVDAERNPIIDPEEIYGGCIGRAQVRARAYGGGNSGFKPGVVFDIIHFQKLSDGDAFGGNIKRTNPEDVFDDIDTNNDPSNDREIPF